MAQMEFYFTDDERKALFNFIQVKGGRFVPDLYFYNTNQYHIITDGDEFLDYIQLKQITHYLVIDNSFTFEPLIVSPNKYQSEPAYSIEQRTGGPYIDFSFYLGYANNDRIPYKSSVIDTWYQN